MSDTTNPRQLIAGLQRDDPKLWEALNFVFDNVDKINDELFPTIAEIQRELGIILPEGPSGFTSAFLPQSIGFLWNFVPNALQYEIRVGFIDSWDNGDFVLRTTSLTALIPPKTLGTYIFMLRTISASGDYSESYQKITVIVDGPAPVAVVAEVIDNNVLLTWQPSVSEFQISHYIIKRNSVIVGSINGTFAARFETASGTYTYGITPVDIAGNAGPENLVVASVNQPPDFILQASQVSNWAGEKSNCYAYDI